MSCQRSGNSVLYYFGDIFVICGPNHDLKVRLECQKDPASNRDIRFTRYFSSGSGWHIHECRTVSNESRIVSGLCQNVRYLVVSVAVNNINFLCSVHRTNKMESDVHVLQFRRGNVVDRIRDGCLIVLQYGYWRVVAHSQF